MACVAKDSRLGQDVFDVQVTVDDCLLKTDLIGEAEFTMTEAKSVSTVFVYAPE